MQDSNSNDNDNDNSQFYYDEQGHNGYVISPALTSSESAGILSAASTSTGNGASLEGDEVRHGSQYSHEDAHSYASPPHTPFSPRAMAIQQLRRAASQREGRNGGAGVNAESQQQESSTLNTPISTNTSENGHSAHSHSSSTGSPLNRGPSIKRIGLERSTSDAARRMAMAKLTGEKITAPPEYTMPKTPLPAGPLPSLADLQARHEQRLALGSPEPIASTSYAHSRSPSAGLSRNPSSGSNAALSRHPSAASSAARSTNNNNISSNLSRNPSVARSLASRAGAHSPSQSMHDLTADGEDEQKRTEERQEARTNLIRKLSRGRLAGAAAAANIRDRHAANGGLASSASQPQMPDLPGSPAQVPDSPSVSLSGSSSDLQRRPSLAGLLSRAESRNQARAQTPETPQRQHSVRRAVTPLSGQMRSPSGSPSSQREEISTPSTSTTHSHTHSLSQASQASPFSMQSMLSPPGPASSAGGMSNAGLPPHTETILSAASHHSSAHAKSPASANSLAARRGVKGKYEHIPVPPTPETASSLTSASASASGSLMGASFASESGRAMPTHESVYSAVSNFRPYRHTMERDRDSAMARMQMEDNFEFELSALEAARASAAPLGTLAKAALLHENHPLSADDEDEDESQRSQRIPSMVRSEQEHDEDRDLEMLPSPAQISHDQPHSDSEPELQYQQQVPPPALRLGSSANDSQFFSPPDSPLDARMIPRRAPPQNDLLSAAGPANPHWSTATASTSLSAQARDRSADSLPETPTSISPASPFTFSPVGSRALSPRVSDSGRDSMPTNEAPRPTLVQQGGRIEAQEQPSGFLRHHQKTSTDDFPVSVISSHASRYPADMSLIPPEQQHTPPLPSMSASVARDGTVAPPVAMQSAMKEKDTPQRVSASPPPLPEKDSPPSSRKKPAFESDQQAALGRASPTPVARALFSKKQESPVMQARALDAGPDSEYRFPTAGSRHRRPESYTSSNDTHDENINSMIDQLEAMQANGTPDARSQYKTPPTIANKTFPEQATRRADAPVPVQANVKPAVSAQQTAAGLASQLRQPLQRTAQARQASTERASHAATAAATSSSSNAAGQTFRFPADPPPYASTESAENDSAPSLARSGTGSSSDQSGPSEGLPMAEPSNANAQAKEQVMQRLSQLSSSYGNQPKQPTALEKPPRQLLLHSPVLQVVNSNTVKDRFLFLFTDIMVIAKPLVEEDTAGEPITPSLDTKFVVKSIVELPKLKLTAQTADTGEDPVQKRKHPLLLTFVDRFANDPKKAVTALIAKAGLSNDATTIANLLFRNPELNRSQLGAYMAHKDQKPVLKAYCDRFRLTGIRIEDALRVFIASLRLPNDYAAAEYMLGVFASQWLSSNPGTGMTNDGVVATKLVISMMELNDALHSGIDDEAAAAGNLFSFPNSAITVDDFIAAFRLKDPHGALPDEHLTRIYLSIRKDRLQQAADNAIVSGIPEIDVVTHPSKLPNRLTYRQASENISLTLPKVDPKFAIKLVGQDLRFEPPILTFARSRTATFRVTPTGLGSKAMLFIRLGQNAHLYRNLPINKTFSVERAFMNHTFQLAFVNHLGVKRKYLFSMNSAESKYTWVDTLRSKIESSPIEQADTPRPAKLSSAISLQVLRDALIAPDEPAPVLVNKPAAPGLRPGFNTPPQSRGRSAGGLQRSTSFSKTYPHGLGKAEADLNERRPSATNITGLTALSARRGSKDDERVSTRHKSGKDIVTAVQQNSLLPLVLGFVSAGQGIDAMPRKPVIPDESAVQPLPPQARGTGRFRDL